MKNTSIQMGCEKMDNKNNNQDSLDVAGRNFEVEDYKREDTLSSGLAETHEQVSDTFMEGEIQSINSELKGKAAMGKKKE